MAAKTMGARAVIPTLTPLALALALGCVRGPGEPTKGADFDPLRPTSGPMEGVANYAKVSEALHRGAQPTELGYDQLRRRGIRTIVSLRVLALDRRRLPGHGFRYHHISVKHLHPELEDVLAFLAIVTQTENQPVFVHCRKGVDRTGMMVAAYRMVVQGWPREEALAEMKRMGFNEIDEPIEDFVERLDVADVRRRLARTPPRIEVIP
jgi:protein tyrosine phosphatase (PTP) superfamily phosphohydrolase (DUF442 family)